MTVKFSPTKPFTNISNTKHFQKEANVNKLLDIIGEFLQFVNVQLSYLLIELNI